MGPDDFNEWLPPALLPRSQELWLHYAQEEDFPEADRFLAWLHAKNLLTAEEFQESLQRQRIEVTSFEEAFKVGSAVETQFNPSWEPGTASPHPQKRSAYAMLSTLGKGAMGLVHLAKDQDLQRKVAYKQLLEEGQQNRMALARFLREAQITAQLDHPNIVPIYSMEVTDNGSLAYSMKLVQGKTFKDLLQDARKSYGQTGESTADTSIPQLLDYFLKVCDAIAYAHSKGVIHRDLKPANIMVGRYNEVYVMDWGIAKVVHHAEPPEEWVDILSPEDEQSGEEGFEERTRQGQVLGTPRYMSPQQAAGKNDELDGRSDQFALGLILYEILTLKPAFKANSPIELLKKVLKADKEPWSDYHPNRKISPELKAIVNKATERKTQQRYADVYAMSEDIRRVLRGEAPLARPDNLWRRGARWIGRHRELTLLVLIGILLSLGLLVIAGLYQRQQEWLKAQQREQLLLNFFTRVSQQSQHLDSFFQRMESLVQGLATATTQALTYGPISKDPLYINNPFAPVGKMFVTPDLIPSRHYGGEISPVWPVYVISPGVNQRAIESKLRKIAPLRHVLKDVLMQSYTPGAPPMPKAQWDQLLADQGVPILWSYICLKEGVLFFYPGYHESTKDYDVLKRPYYTQSLGRYDKVWGAPYLDPEGGPVIPNTLAISQPDGQFLGVVGIDIRLSYLIETYLRLPQEVPVQESFLLNQKGEILLRSDEKNRPTENLNLDEHYKTLPYAHKPVVEAIVRKKAGGYLLPQPGQTTLLAYYRLNTLGWYYVVEVDYPKLLAAGGLAHE